MGAALGMVVVVVVAAVKEWTPALDVRLALARPSRPGSPGVAGAPAAGALAGLLAGLYPSLRASAGNRSGALRS
ncbi:MULTISPECIES: hypothetical protein [unclassified Streptomyces]|uniref:hypothetical protein n=1 Tax=unclassified Streptomyces TaxID=2593676 RepID=UPI00081BA9AF|nr:MULTISPECIES: hypothetical protein [unclassified Streptomyces]SCD32545.1 putative ABC transport system permease protein [Streptomyces sp. BpilaLS-43]